MDLNLKGKRAVVCGSSQGIGRDRLEAGASFGETQPLIVTRPVFLYSVS